MRAKKSLGQHFLRCKWVAETMVKAADLNSSDTVLEIGPGTGALTRELAKYANQVIAVEKDERLAEQLKNYFEKTGVKNVKIISADALNLLSRRSLDSIEASPRYKVVANIPYYLTSRLLRLLLESDPPPETIVLTIQKEVAQRITAKPPKMNLLAFTVQFCGKPEIIKTVPKECFSPRPSIDSAIIKISQINRDISSKIDWRKIQVFKIAKELFAHKRKTILNNLSSLLKKPEAAKILDQAGAPHQKRAEELSINEIIRIAKEFDS